MNAKRAVGAAWRWGAVVAALVGLGPARAAAQTIPVVLVQVQGEGPVDGAAAVARVAQAVGPSALHGVRLAQEVDARYGALPVTGDLLAPARARISQARAAWQRAERAGNQQAADEALDALDAAAQELEREAEAREAREVNGRTLQEALVFLAERYRDTGSATRAEEAMRRLARVDPSVAFTAQAASPEVQRMYAAAQASQPRGGLLVESVPSSCTVVRDGRDAGDSPVEIHDLTPGEHRIMVRCGALQSRMHRVRVAAGARATLVINVELDTALSTDPLVALRYATPEQARARLVADLALLGRALGARRIYGVSAARGRATVVDVGTVAAEVGEAPLDDARSLEAMARQPVASRAQPTAITARRPPVAAPAPQPPRREVVTTTRGGGVPLGAVVLGVLGVGVGAAGVVALSYGLEAETLALQEPMFPERRAQREGEARTLRWVEVGCYAAGGALVLTGVLVGILGSRGETVTTTTLRAGLVPIPGGSLITVSRGF